MIKLSNAILSDKIESAQYNAALVITWSLRELSKDKLYLELDLDSLKNIQWFKCLCCLYKIVSTKMRPFLFEILTPLQRSQRDPSCFKPLRCQTELFQKFFLPFTISQ